MAVARQDNDELLGDLAIHFIDNEQVEIGFTIAPKYQRQRIASIVIKRLLAYVFLTLHKHRVIAVTDTENIASWQPLEGLNFRR
ncbi:GNAT family N-acetyltransferase [Thalassotalea insulae]|uniref:GNAT family N-acetyltransferase n=1 Tax=Thalassotalea insulae TaxID=2056778 RepID=UPI0024E0E740|nr:GNAT family protein [Thalassotalea insulae]